MTANSAELLVIAFQKFTIAKHLSEASRRNYTALSINAEHEAVDRFLAAVDLYVERKVEEKLRDIAENCEPLMGMR
jgi:hypothetical protein